ncbi:MAG: hypothetical protein WAM28_02390 [Chlamydiales bacterium]
MTSLLVNLIYPPICLHCQTPTQHLFCEGCSAFFELIDPATRCPYCFADNDKARPCSTCIKQKRWELQMASALNAVGPVATLVEKLKYGKLPYLAKTAAAFMTLQLANLDWPEIDTIVPVPPRLWFQRPNHATLVAKSLSHYIRKPWDSLIGRWPGDLPQAYLDSQEREKLSESSFYLKKRTRIKDKVLLVVDDLIGTGTTLRKISTTLGGGFPRKVYALTLASH